ncbi:hypothetical protein C1884_04045 [Pseudomonas sp. GW460-R15]|nr:hypothetical protein C1887_04470 [Pseudomonas sp. GW456-R21]POA70537.1 hypothetical protein C1884_04045 [Pseudomonas sp. GW460-R15]
MVRYSLSLNVMVAVRRAPSGAPVFRVSSRSTNLRSAATPRLVASRWQPHSRKQQNVQSHA